MELYKSFNKKTRSAFRKKHRKSDDPHQVLVCPFCGNDKVRPVKVSIHAGHIHTHVSNKGTLCEGEEPAGWGTTINLKFAGACGHQFILNHQYYDKETEFEVVNVSNGEADTVIHWEPEEEKAPPKRKRR